MKQIIIYEPDGFIVSVAHGSDEYVPSGDEDILEAVLDEQELYHPDKHYFDTEADLVRRQKKLKGIQTNSEPVEGGWLITLQNIPANTKVWWPDDEMTIETDGVVECEVNLPGEYQFRLDHVAHFDLEVIVNVEA